MQQQVALTAAAEWPIVATAAASLLTLNSRYVSLAGSNDDEKVVSRKMMGLFDGMKAVNKATKVVESHVSGSS